MYVKLIDGHPERYTIQQLRKDNPNTSFPETVPDNILADYGVYPVIVDERPATETWQRAVRDDLPVQDANGNWTLGWTVEDISATAEMVKAEAQRRILHILPEWKQRNLTARAAELAIKGQSNWTTEETAEHTAGQAVWDQIKAIRTKSDEIEAMTPIPSDFKLDSYWI